MARAFVRVGLGLCLSSCVGLWSLAAAAQGGGDIVEDDSAPADKDDSGDQSSAKEDEPDDGDGDWSGGGGGGSSESGFHVGLRLGYGFPLGKVLGAATGGGLFGSGSTTKTADLELPDLVAGQIPLWLDLGWQFTPAFMAGAYFSYGFVLPSGDLADACDEERASCTLNDIRLGLQVQLSFAPGRSVDPWLGVGAGYEWFSLNVNDSTTRFHGYELLMLQGGIDFGGDSAGSTIGPFAAFTLGQYSRVKVKSGSIDKSEDVADLGEEAMHNWLFVGIRGTMK